MGIQATRRPWNLPEEDKEPNRVYDLDNRKLFTVQGHFTDNETDRANAELIVRAVNCHDELVHELELFLRIETNGSSTYNRIESLLKRARGES